MKIDIKIIFCALKPNFTAVQGRIFGPIVHLFALFVKDHK